MFIFQVTIAVCLMLLFSTVDCVDSNYNTCKNGNIHLGNKELTKSDKQRILKAHNYYRNLVASGQEPGQPPAENMIQMTWDDEAALEAYKLASECKFDHKITYTSKTKERMGQNLKTFSHWPGQDLITTFDQNINDMIKGWYLEVQNYTYGNPFSFKTGHYTQLIWANSFKVGCGYTYYKESDSEWHTGELVCNYVPAGNVRGQKPYIEGTRNCEKHNLIPSKRYSHLCRTTQAYIKARNSKNSMQTQSLNSFGRRKTIFIYRT